MIYNSHNKYTYNLFIYLSVLTSCTKTSSCIKKMWFPLIFAYALDKNIKVSSGQQVPTYLPSMSCNNLGEIGTC